MGLRSGTIITQDEAREEKIGSYTISMVPVWKWLLMPEI